MIGTNWHTIKNWEKGRTPPAVRHYPKIIEFLGYNPLPASANLSEEIARQRVTLGMFRRRLAQLSGIDEKTVARIERGTHLLCRPMTKINAALSVLVSDPKAGAHGNIKWWPYNKRKPGESRAVHRRLRRLLLKEG